MRRRFCSLALVAALIPSARAEALPVFAHRFGVSCQQCHTTVPRLNAFGQAFRAGGFRWPANQSGAFPVAVKVNLAYSSAPDASGLPKAVVDEVELLTAGRVGASGSYFVEQYALDGGRPGRTRDAWLQEDAREFHLRAGQFTLPLPVDPETQRDTQAHYAIYDQTVGANSFDFFEPRLGLDAFATLARSKIEAHLVLSGSDAMAYVAKTAGTVTLSAYRYGGTRRPGAYVDRFWRQGYGATYAGDRWTLTGVVQNGNDANADGTHDARSSGGFLQARYDCTPSLWFVARYDATAGSLGGFSRGAAVSAIARVRSNMRLTLEDDISANHHNLTTALLFAY